MPNTPCSSEAVCLPVPSWTEALQGVGIGKVLLRLQMTENQPHGVKHKKMYWLQRLEEGPAPHPPDVALGGGAQCYQDMSLPISQLHSTGFMPRWMLPSDAVSFIPRGGRVWLPNSSNKNNGEGLVNLTGLSRSDTHLTARPQD